MARAFLDEQAKAALTRAAQEIEGRSSAEMVVVVRPSSGSYVHADLVFGGCFAWATLWFQLFSPWEYSLPSIFAAPLVVGAVAAAIASRSPVVHRWLTKEAARRRAVRTEAQSTFFEKGIGLTSGRTGILVFISLAERAVEVVADKGIRDRVPAAAWSAAVAAVDKAVRDGANGAAVAEPIAALGDVLEPVLPRRADDVDELADEVVA